MSAAPKNTYAVKSPSGEPARAHLHIRCTEAFKAALKAEARRRAVPVAEIVIQAVNKAL